MKKFLSFLLACLLLVTASGSFTASKAANTSLLPNVYAKMKKGEDIHIGYFGGSVTNGFGATQGVNCWRGLSQRWLNDNYGAPNGGSFYEGTHAGLGGSGTPLNIYRANEYLDLDGSDPVDLLFIEFSINDGYIGSAYEKSAYYMESIIHKVRKMNPECDIVLCVTTDFGYSSGTKDFIYAQAHKDVAQHYGVPVVDFGAKMWEFLTKENGGVPLTSQSSALWLKYYRDGCHPNANGYAKYFEFLRDGFLIPNLDSSQGFSTTVVNHTLPSTNYNTTEKFMQRHNYWQPGKPSVYYNKPLRTDAYMVFPSEVKNFKSSYGFEEVTGRDATVTTQPGASFRAVFNSKSAGIFYTGEAANGLLRYSVDGGEWQSFNMYNSNANEHFMLYDDLPAGTHTVDVILRKTNTGSKFTLRGFFIDGDPAESGVTFGDIPNSLPLEDIYHDAITLTPEVLDSKVSGNTGAELTQIHHHTDVPVLQFTPDSQSSDYVVSNNESALFKTVQSPLYKYAVISYFYDVPSGVTASAKDKNPMMHFYNLNGLAQDYQLYSPDKIVANSTENALLDLTVFDTRKLHQGFFSSMQLYPYGLMKGNQLASAEQMAIRSIKFYVEYPFGTTKTVNANKSITSSGTDISLEGEKILPSAYKYATVNYSYSGSTATELTLTASGLYNTANGKNDRTISASKKLSAGKNSVIINVSEIAESGHISYLDKITLSADIASGESFTVNSITYTTQYPNPSATFDIKFDANGGSGTVPETINAKIGTSVLIPDVTLTKAGHTFAGWNTDKNAVTGLYSIIVPEDGATLYAIFTKTATIRFNANGGTGTLPKAVNSVVSTEYTLPTDTNLTKNGYIFVGWNTDKNANTALKSVTVPNNGVTVYAIYKQINTYYVTKDTSGKVSYNGKLYVANHTSISDALAEAGSAITKIIFNGVQDGDSAFKAVNNASPLVIIEGADNSALLRCTQNVTLGTDTTLENLGILKAYGTSAATDVYINGNGKKFTVGKNVKFYDEASSKDGKIAQESQIKVFMCGGDAEINSGSFVVFAGAGSNSTSQRNQTITFNNVDDFSSFNNFMGVMSFTANSKFTQDKNLTVVVNGGKWTNEYTFKVDGFKGDTTITGAVSAIINNDLNSTYNFKYREFNYIINSGKGGKVSLHTEATPTKAPTFLLRADTPTTEIYINGNKATTSCGEYLFTPDTRGTYSITYVETVTVNFGDVNDDGEINFIDAMKILRIASESDIPTDKQRAAADINSDGDVNFIDAMQCLRLASES